MENITIGQVASALAFLGGLIGSVEYLSFRLKKWLKTALKDEIEPLKKSIDDETLNRCKGDLVSLMSRIKNGYVPTEEERRILIETKQIYNEHGGDSYVDDMFDGLKKEGKI